MTLNETATQATEIPGYCAGTWSVDPAHTEVGFSVSHLMISKVRGKFTDFTATFVTAPDPLESRVTFDFEFGGFGELGGGYRGGASAKAVINREDFGLTYNQTLETGGVLVGDKVTITLDFQAVLDQ